MVKLQEQPGTPYTAAQRTIHILPLNQFPLKWYALMQRTTRTTGNTHTICIADKDNMSRMRI
jgi:hypothetical protein